MGSVAASSVPADDAHSSRAVLEVSLFRLYTLRASYLVLAVGLGVYVWPAVINHTNEFAATRGVQVALLAGLGATAALGLRYPVKMLPLLLFELVWKTIYLIGFAAPLWAAHQINAAVAEDITVGPLCGHLCPAHPVALRVRELHSQGRRALEIVRFSKGSGS